MDEKIPRGTTLKSLRIDVQAAMDGRTWAMLPEGFRSADAGHAYPLPTRRGDLQKLIAIPIPPGKADCGTIYLKRSIRQWKNLEARRTSAVNDISKRQARIQERDVEFTAELKAMRQKAKDAVEGVREEAAIQTASLRDLFAMGRKGLKDQMQAYLDNKQLNDEKISAKGFRDCFSLVSAAVKGLGMPTEQKASARDAVIEEAAAAIKDMKETVALAPGTDSDTEH